MHWYVCTMHTGTSERVCAHTQTHTHALTYMQANIMHTSMIYDSLSLLPAPLIFIREQQVAVFGVFLVMAWGMNGASRTKAQ